MDKESEQMKLSEILALRERGKSFAEISERIGETREAVRQGIALAESPDDDAPRMTGREAVREFADAVFIGDDLVFFEIIKDHPQIIRWCNPAAWNGGDQLASLREELLDQATMRENARSTGNRVMLVLSDSSAVSCEVLHALVIGADEVTIVASRTTLRTILQSSKHGLVPD